MGEKALILEPEEFKQIFTEKKREILNKLYLEDYDSISDLVEDLDRNYSIVNRDLAMLEDIGVVEMEDEGSRKKPVLVDTNIRVETCHASDLFPLPDSYSDSEKFNKDFLEETRGIEIGKHEGEDVYLDRWNLEDDYNQLTAGKIGSGKSYSSKLQILRTYKEVDDLHVVMVDPVGGFEKINRLLDGEKTTIGENMGINPMDIKKIPEEIRENREGDTAPYHMKISSLMDFFEMYLNKRDVELDKTRGVLEKAIKETYNDFGITREPHTHSKESPTIYDLLEKLEHITYNPRDYFEYSEENNINYFKTDCKELLMQLGHLKPEVISDFISENSSFDLRDNKISYFDLSQQEGSGNVGPIMHLIFWEVYQKAQLTDDKVMFIIDEAHYLMDDAGKIDFLEASMRHSPKIDLSINFITQDINYFAQQDQASSILEKCSVRLLHRTEKRIEDDIMNTLGLDDKNIDYIRNASPGSTERGYSEALFGIKNEGYLPIRVESSDEEHELLEHNKVLSDIISKDSE